MNDRKKITVTAALCVFFTLTLIIGTVFSAGNRSEREQSGALLSRFPKDKITSITIQSGDQSVALTVSADSPTVDYDGTAAAADKTAVDEFYETVAGLPRGKKITSNEERYNDFGVADGASEISVRMTAADAEEWNLLIGKTTTDGKRYVRAEGDSVVYETDDPGWTLYTRRSHWVKLALFDDPSVSAEIQSVVVKGTSPTDGETFDYTLMKTAGESDGTLIWKAEGHEETLDTVKIDSFLRQITELRGADLIVPPVGLTSETAAVTIVLGFRDGSKQTLCISSDPAGEDRYGVTLADSDREYAVSRYALGNLLKPLENFFRAEEK